MNSERLYQSSGKEKESSFLVCTSSTTSENRHFDVVVVQRRLRNVQKSVIHVQSSCFANLNLLLFCRSRFRYRRPCLGSQLKTPWGLRVNAFHSNSPKHWKFRGGSLEKNKRERGVGSFCFVCQFFFGIVACLVASHADVLRDSSSDPAARTLDKCSPLIGGAVTRDEPLRTSAWEATCLDVLNPKSQLNTLHPKECLSD